MQERGAKIILGDQNLALKFLTEARAAGMMGSKKAMGDAKVLSAAVKAGAEVLTRDKKFGNIMTFFSHPWSTY